MSTLKPKLFSGSVGLDVGGTVSSSFWICGHKDGRHAGVHHFHVGEEFVSGLGLSNFPMDHELVGHFVTLLSHVFVIADGSF